MSESQADNLALAYHEAGHALLQWYFGWNIQKLSILGHNECDIPLPVTRSLYRALEALRQMIADHQNSSKLLAECDELLGKLHKKILKGNDAEKVMMNLAGPIAQELGTGNWEFEDTVDFVEIKHIVHTVLEHFRPSLDALAEALRVHKELDGDEAEAILREASR